MHFCPDCGTSVYWEADLMPGHVGIAAGTFFDPGFPAPTVSAWEQSKHPWVAFGHQTLHRQKQREAVQTDSGEERLSGSPSSRMAASRPVGSRAAGPADAKDG